MVREEYRKELSRVRIERAEELLEEAKSLLSNGSYKSANNRAYYSIEKSLNALLAVIGVESSTHNGCLKQFNFHYIHNGDGTFTPDDYRIAAMAEQIRSISDYDDFYIASRTESEKQIESAEYLMKKIKSFLKFI